METLLNNTQNIETAKKLTHLGSMPRAIIRLGLAKKAMISLNTGNTRNIYDNEEAVDELLFSVLFSFNCWLRIWMLGTDKSSWKFFEMQNNWTKKITNKWVLTRINDKVATTINFKENRNCRAYNKETEIGVRLADRNSLWKTKGRKIWNEIIRTTKSFWKSVHV